MTGRVLGLVLAAVPLWGGEFTSQLWAGIGPIYEKTIRHPFLRGLAGGTLPREKFQFYLLQDRRYLRVFGQALSVLASKAPRAEWATTLNRHAIDSLQEERLLHERILASWGVPAASMEAPMAPSTYAYTNHLLAAVHRLSFAEGLAAVLPCYWIYEEVGKELKKRGSKDPAYQKWIDTYAGDEYGAVVKQVLAMMDEEAARSSPAVRQSARELFVVSARYEYLFWDAAWRLEKWAP